MNPTANTYNPRTRSKATLAMALFALLGALLFGSLFNTGSASAETPPADKPLQKQHQEYPTGYFRICKVYEATGDADQPDTTFKFNVKVDFWPHDSVTDNSFQVELTLAEGEKGCSDPLPSPILSNIHVTEVAPDGWNHAAGYPKYKASGAGLNVSGTGEQMTFLLPRECQTASCTVVYTNKEDGPKRIPVRVCKSYLSNDDAVLNIGTIFDFDINGKPFNINAAESETNCKIVYVTVSNLNEDVTVTEHLPGTWDSAPGYPRVEMDNDPFDDNDHGVSSNSITFEIGACLNFNKPQLRTAASAQEFACTIVFYNLEDVPGDECVPGGRECPEITCEDLGNCPEVDCEERRECPEVTCEELGNCPEVTCEELGNCPEEECTENCDEPQCTEPCGEPLCADGCDDTPGEEPKAPNTGTGLLVGTATNPMVLASTGIAIIMATVLLGTAALPKRR